jgi:hypothetical protein
VHHPSGRNSGCFVFFHFRGTSDLLPRDIDRRFFPRQPNGSKGKLHRKQFRVQSPRNTAPG